MDVNTELEEPPVTQSEIDNWYRIVKELKALKKTESVLRKRISSFYFPTPDEGTNIHDLGGGFNLKLTSKLTRSIDEALLQAHKLEFVDFDIDVDKLIKLKPSLVLSQYKKLSDKQTLIFDQVLTIKPATPALEIVKGKA